MDDAQIKGIGLRSKMLRFPKAKLEKGKAERLKPEPLAPTPETLPTSPETAAAPRLRKTREVDTFDPSSRVRSLDTIRFRNTDEGPKTNAEM